MAETAREKKARIKAAAQRGVDSAETLNPKQIEAMKLLGSDARHVMLFGGARSGKTFILVRSLVVRAIKAADSRHLIARFRFNHCKQYIGLDTFPTVMKTCFPGVPYKLDKQDWFVKLPNESEIWLGGLDEKERTEKILGAEYSTALLEEVSQISWQARQMVTTRVAQQSGLKLKTYYSCNPPPMSHWAYKVFIKKEDPITNQPLTNPRQFASMLMNPVDNLAHIHEDYIDELRALPDRMRRRFLDGEFLPVTENALWTSEIFDEYRIAGGGAKGSDHLPDLVRVVVAVDPSGASDDEEKNNDDIGIVVAGLGTDGRSYVLEDLTCRGSPEHWGKIVASAYDRHRADMVIGEANYGGDMVRYVVQTARPNTPFKAVHSSRGKILRAEPIAALYEQGKVHHVGNLSKLEDELCEFTTAGHLGTRSPNRADALVFALTELFPGMVRVVRKPVMVHGASEHDVYSW